MSTRQLFSASRPASGRKSALSWAADQSSVLPNSVLYLLPPEVDDETVHDSWEQYGNPLAIEITPFDEIVDRLYEGSTYEGESVYASGEQRRWLVEAALTQIDDPTNPLHLDGEPTVGLVEQAMELLTLLEFAGLDSPKTVHKRLEELGLHQLASPLSIFFQYVLAIREEAFGSKLTFRSERYLHSIRRGPDIIPTILNTTDVVVVGAFQTLSPLERDLLDQLASVFDTAVVFPRVTDTPSPTGVDQAVSRLAQWYESIGFDTAEGARRIGSVGQSPRDRLAHSLYRYEHSAEQSVELPQEISVHSYPTIRHEVAGLAREIRSLIADGLSPEQICVAVYDEDTYTELLAQQLNRADVPVTYDTQRSFFETATGGLFEAVLDLGTEQRRQDPLVRLLSNPLVMPEQGSVTEEIVQLAERMESTRVDRLREQLDDSAVEVVDNIVAASQDFVEMTDLVQAREELLAALAVPVDDQGTGLADDLELPGKAEDEESSALFLSARVCESLTAVDSETSIAEIRRALEQTTIDTTVGRQSNSVRIASPTHAISNSFSYVFAPGLTSEHTPSPVRRLAFARKLKDSHPDFAAADPVRRTQYTFGLLLASETRLQLSMPEKNANGDPYVLADVLMELKRLTDIKIESQGMSATTPATHEDVYRSLAKSLETGGITESGIQADVDSFDIEIAGAHPQSRLKEGLDVAAARGQSEIGKYDAQVSANIVDQFRDSDRPFSPSSLETYASCGFKFYMESVLDIEADDEITIELDALDAGTYVHDVLEQFYREWLSRGHTAVTEGNLNEAQSVLYEVASTELQTVRANETAFHQNWSASLFDGLSTTNNEYGDPEADPGLLRRFLDAEVTLAARDAQPAKFEAHVGLGTEDPDANVISAAPVRVPNSDVSIHGKIDRIDLTTDGGIVAYDYKTGSTPSESDTLDGLKFQLPAYLLMASEIFGSDPIGASYYQVNPSSSISFHAGTIGAEADATYHTKQSTKPLRRHYTLEFDEREEFREFLYNDVVSRIRDVSNAVQSGSFHPTVLDPDTAGCEYCEYRDACDVRHHRRHEIRGDLEEKDIPRYIPATEGSTNE